MKPFSLFHRCLQYYGDMGKPRPKTEVMKVLKGKGYIDAKDFAGDCEPVVMIAKGQSNHNFVLLITLLFLLFFYFQVVF